MILIVFSRSIILDLPWLIVPLEPIIVYTSVLCSTRERVYEILQLVDSSDGGVYGTTSRGPTH